MMLTMFKRRERNSSISRDYPTNFSRGTNGERQWDTTNIVDWLESPEGQEWSKEFHFKTGIDGNHIYYQLVSVKDDNRAVDAILWYARV